MQTERGEFYRDKLKYKEKVTQYKNKIKHHDKIINLMEKEKIELEAFKNSVTTMPTQSVQSEKYSKYHVKAMASLQLKDKEIPNMKVSLVKKVIEINTLRGLVTQKEKEVKEVVISKNQMKDKISKYSKKLVEKYIMREARYEIWDQLSL